MVVPDNALDVSREELTCVYPRLTAMKAAPAAVVADALFRDLRE